METQGNTYQDTLAKLQMNFAVELLSSGSTPLSNHVVIKTGDNNQVLLFGTCSGGRTCFSRPFVVRVKRTRKEDEAAENRLEKEE